MKTTCDALTQQVPLFTPVQRRISGKIFLQGRDGLRVDQENPYSTLVDSRARGLQERIAEFWRVHWESGIHCRGDGRQLRHLFSIPENDHAARELGKKKKL